MENNKGEADTVDLTEQAFIRAWNHLSINYIVAAALLSRRSYELESEAYRPASQELILEYQSYVLGAVVSSAAFLEATINEFFAGAADADFQGQLAPFLGVGATETLGELWKTDTFERGSGVLLKFQVALMTLGKQRFDRGGQPYQDVHLLISLRNTLLHYKPAWVYGGTPERPRALVSALGTKFALNPLFPPQNPLFPDRLLSHGCAAWAVATCLAFTDEFF